MLNVFNFLIMPVNPLFMSGYIFLDIIEALINILARGVVIVDSFFEISDLGETLFDEVEIHLQELG